MRQLHQIIPQPVYANYLRETAEFNKEFLKSLPAEEREKMQKFAKTKGHDGDVSERENGARALIKAQAENKLKKAGVTTGLGYNFFDLRGPAYLEYPVNVPFRNSLPRMGRVNDGVGTAAHWKATRNVGSNYAGASEGKRVSTATPDENDYVATYKELGIERAASFTSQFAGEGYTDNVADEHLRGLHELWLQEEGLMLCGNSGTATGNNGYLLGTANTPTSTLLVQAGLIPNATNVSCRVVEITALGLPNNNQYGYGANHTVAGGLVPSFTRNNADGTTDTINGGTGVISAASNVVLTAAGSNQVKFAVTPKQGAYAWAWFVDVTDASAPTLANAKLTAITTLPTFTYNLAAPAGTQAGTATGLNVDSSANALDFDGLLTYAASTAGSYFVNLAGGSLTSNHDGSVQDIETALQTIWNLYQAQVSAIWCSADARVFLEKTIRASGTNPSSYRFDYARDSQNNLMGGFVVSAYQSKFSMLATGGNALPIRIHPMLPAGTIFFDVETNPYPHSRVPFVRGMLVQRDYYGIEWPVTTRQWTFGTYCHEVLAHNFPWISAVITGIGGAGA